MSEFRLSADEVNKTFLGCLFTDEEVKEVAPELPKELIKAEGVNMHIGFHSGRLNENRELIRSMLMELPETFYKSSGGGWSFLNACLDKHGNHWAEHPTMDELFTLGIGLGLVDFIFPREFWNTLPGGVPYVVVLDLEEEERST